MLLTGRQLPRQLRQTARLDIWSIRIQTWRPRRYATTTTTNDIQGGKYDKFDDMTDVLIIGSGGAGLTAALRSRALSLKSIVVEKTDKIGGTTALSGGGLWIPNNPYLRETGRKDSIEKALTYMNHCIGDVGPASSHARRVAFLENGPRMIEFLRELGFHGRASGQYPNYYPDLPGGDVPRSVESDVFDARKLGPWFKLIRRGKTVYPPIFTDESSRLFRSLTSLSNMLYAARIMGFRGLGRKLLGQHPVTLGPGLISQLLHLNLRHELVIWRESKLTELLIRDGAVVGACIDRAEQGPVRIRARRGVLLAAGGFARNSQMRAQFQENPIGAAWTSAQEGDVGDAIRIASNTNAQLALMDDAWWGPTVVDPANGDRFFILCERSLPHSIIVDTSGCRFMNESQSYTNAGQKMFERNRKVPAIPAWIIMDARHRRKYPFASLSPGSTPNSALKSGFIYEAGSLAELANQIEVDPTGLNRTVQHFNDMARRGTDDDFGRGGNEYDQWFADPKVTPNGSLGSIEKAPFYAARVWPGDLGTKGGLLTDEKAQVIDKSGRPIRGLYAAGNTTASVMGRSYPGPGSTLGPALTFAYIAVNNMATQDA